MKKTLLIAAMVGVFTLTGCSEVTVTDEDMAETSAQLANLQSQITSSKLYQNVSSAASSKASEWSENISSAASSKASEISENVANAASSKFDEASEALKQKAAEEISKRSDELASKAVEEFTKRSGELSEETASAISDYANSYINNADITEVQGTVNSILASQGVSVPDTSDVTSTGILKSKSDIGLASSDGQNYVFSYDGEEFKAVYTTDNWKIIDSYRISNADDIQVICQALIDEHPVHGQDMSSYRTAADMAYEWLQHNIAYAYLPDDNQWKKHAKDVDLDPADQGRTFQEIYKDRTGKELKIEDILNR